MYPPRVWAPQVSICAFAAGVFTGGGGLKNQLKKVAIGVDTTCLASENSGSETNAQGAVAILQPRVLACGSYGLPRCTATACSRNYRQRNISLFCIRQDIPGHH